MKLNFIALPEQASDEEIAAIYAHLSNIHDPEDPRAKLFYCYSLCAKGDSHLEAMEWQRHIDRIQAALIGPPKATTTFTRDQLKQMNIVGLYAPLNVNPSLI